jgi:hypothetical protein
VSNLPPGVNENMLPGNRPDEIAWEQLVNEFAEWLDDHGIGPYADEHDNQARVDAFCDALDEALKKMSEFYRDPFEETMREAKCARCENPVGAGWDIESRRTRYRGIEGWEEYDEDVVVCGICPDQAEKEPDGG